MGSFTIFPGNENFVDFILLQFGWDQCEPLYAYGPHIRNNYLFHYVISGTGYVEYNSPEGLCRYWIPAKSGFLICPGQVVTYCADKENPWKYAWVEFNGIQAEYQLLLAGLSGDNPVYTPKAIENALLVETELLQIVLHPTAGSMNLMGHFYLFFSALVSSSCSQARLRSQPQNSYYVNQAVQYIQQNYHSSITSADIAVYCGLSRTHLGRIFKKAMGQTLQKYLTSCRMARAIELMRTTELPLGEIALQVGYANPLYFSKVFRGIYGLPPSVWRQTDTKVFELPAQRPDKEEEQPPEGPA